MFATPQVIAALNVEALAAAFNIDKANVPYRIIPIPEDMFGIGGAGGKGQAVLTTEDFFFCWDEMLETTNSPVNPIDGTRNIFYKHRGSITPNPFANAVLFWTGEGSSRSVTLPDTLTTSKPEFTLRVMKYGQPSITPENVSRGDLVQVKSEITSANKAKASFQPVGIEYEVEGATSQFTSIDNDGILRCGLDETAEVLKVTAQATYIDPAHPEIDQTVSAALSVPVVGTWVGGIKIGALKDLTTLPPSPPSVKVGASVKLTAQAIMADGSTVDVSNLATWAVDKNATVDKTGKVTGTAVGDAVVSVKFAGATTYRTVHVIA